MSIPVPLEMLSANELVAHLAREIQVARLTIDRAEQLQAEYNIKALEAELQRRPIHYDGGLDA